LDAQKKFWKRLKEDAMRNNLRIDLNKKSKEYKFDRKKGSEKHKKVNHCFSMLENRYCF
jgi:hypothetical protein